MMETQTQNTTTKGNIRPTFLQRNALSVKIVLIGLLILILLIPIAMVRGVISERSRNAQDAIREVQDKWSNAQTVTGPYLEIPFEEEVTSVSYENNQEKTQIRKIRKSLYVLPENLDISGTLETEILRRGPYEIVVYKTPLELSGTFALPQDKKSRDRKYLLSQASLSIGLSDLRGISEQITIDWDGTPLPCHSGLPANSIAATGVTTDLPDLQAGDTVRFSVHLHLKGSQSMQFAPLGRTTRVRLASDCPTPSFNGSFLPEQRDVTDSGFTAAWKVLNLNRNYPQNFTSDWKDQNLNTRSTRHFGESYNA